MPTDGDAIVGAMARYSASSNPSNDIFDVQRCASCSLGLELHRCARLAGRNWPWGYFKIDNLVCRPVKIQKLSAFGAKIGPAPEEMGLKVSG